MLIAFTVLGLVAALVADSVHSFAARADVYAARLSTLLGQLLGWIEWATCAWTPSGCPNATNATGNATDPGDPTDDAGAELEKLLSTSQLGHWAVLLAESLLELLSNLFLVLLFTIYLLLGSAPHGSTATSAADAQIISYIKGKVCLSLFVGVLTALILFSVGLDLWLVFGTLAFWLNFVPTVGAVVAVLLPAPLVLLDPSLSTLAMTMALLLPFGVHMAVGNVLEPLIFGHSLELHPVVILCSLMVWGMLWGLTGMVLATPITAVLKIYLGYVDHPVAALLVSLLAGADGEAAGEAAAGLDGAPRGAAAGAGGSAMTNVVGSPSAMEEATRPLVSAQIGSAAAVNDNVPAPPNNASQPTTSCQ